MGAVGGGGGSAFGPVLRAAGLNMSLSCGRLALAALTVTTLALLDHGIPCRLGYHAVWDARTASAADRSYNVVKRKYIHEFLASKADRPLPGDGPAGGGPRSNGDTTIDGDHLVRPRQERKHRTASVFPNVEL